MSDSLDRYCFCVGYSIRYGCFVATCEKFPELEARARSADEALFLLRQLVNDRLAAIRAWGDEEPPV